ncbi:TPA: hypothetical protein ACH3X2_012585 [Trebouxia sp. C0005]
MLQGMQPTADLDGSGGRFAILRTQSEHTSELDNSKSSKRRRRKSAKANLESTDSSEEPSALVHESSGSSTSFAKPPLKPISEAAVLRSNSAEPASALEATSLQSSLRQDRQTAEDVLTRTTRRPHMSLSFQESRPVNEDCLSASFRLPPQGATVSAQQPDDQPQSFAQYLQAELYPEAVYPTPDVIFRQTERDRVYNAIAYVPYQLERLLWYGLLLCCNSFMATFTLLPLRFARAVSCLVRQLGRKGGCSLKGDQLFDIICVGIFACTVLFLKHLNAGAIYFWIKDLTQEFLKLQVIYTAVEMFDKILCSFGVDTLEALSGTCTLYASSTSHSRRQLRHLVSDSLVALVIVVMHGTIIMCQGMAFSVAMNSKRSSALVALLIASNFVEIKGTVMKRFDSSKLFKLACQDVVERFHLLISLLFVLVEEMDNSGHWLPNQDLLWQCGQIFLAEVAIDVAKHAVVGKFNEIRPGVYREFMKDVCERVIASQSHTVHSVMDFEPFGPAGLFLRVTLTFIVIRSEPLSELSLYQWVFRCCTCLLSWGLLCSVCAALGFLLKRLAHLYMQHYDDWYNAKPGRGLNMRTERLGSENNLGKQE